MTLLKSHSQNKESLIVLKYFKGRKGTLLDIGAFDGKSLSNSYDLILEGWKGVMIEPDERSFKCLTELYKNNKAVKLCNIGIAKNTGWQHFYVDAMLSTLYEDQKKDNEIYIETMGWFVTWKYFQEYYLWHSNFQYVTIDAEGADFEILEQMDLREMGTECLCIEHNGNEKMMKDIIDYSAQYGLKELARNNENIILTLKHG